MDSEQLESLWAEVLPLLKNMFENNTGIQGQFTRYYSSVTAYLYRHYDDKRMNPENDRMGTVGSRGWFLYAKIKDYFNSVCRRVREKCAELVDEDLLRYYITEWIKFGNAEKFLNCVFSYLNTYYIDKHNDLGEDPEVTYKIGSLAIITWKKTIFDEYNGKILKTANELINRERQGGRIDGSLIKELSKCCMELGIFVDGKTSSDCVYKDYLEKSFLEATEIFYVIESTKFLEGKSEFMKYLEMVKTRLTDESLRIKDYFVKSTEELVIQVLQSSLIVRHLKYFYAAFKTMLATENYDDARIVSLLVSKYVQDLSEFVNIFQEHISDQGLSSIRGCSEAVGKNPKIYLDSILKIYKKGMDLKDTLFLGNTAFKSAVERATASFVNKNALTMEPNTARKSSELITRYCDQLLRSTNPNQKEEVDEIFKVFEFIEDKDVFHDYYMKLFAKRLVNGTSNDEELESYMILKMKEINGAQSVAKFERMLNDIKLSKDINVAFAENNQESLDVDFNVMVLQFCTWSFASSPRHNLPLELEKCVAQFNKFYSQAHSGKKLIWMYNLSRGEIITNHFKSRYTIQANTRQISILELFNSADSWTVRQIHEQTNIEMDKVLQITQLLLKAKFLTCESAEDLIADSTVYLNLNYNNKKHRININVPLKIETNRELVAVDKNIDQERMYVIQATIVRIMKSQKRITHVELVSQVLEDLTSQFKPKIELIKRNIQTLIDKGYMKHCSTEPNTYDYVA